MVNFTVEQLRAIMTVTDNIRNMSIIAHVDHGKSTLADGLVSRAGIIAKEVAGDARFMDTRPDEKERGITIKSTGVSLFFEFDIVRATKDALIDAAEESETKDGEVDEAPEKPAASSLEGEEPAPLSDEAPEAASARNKGFLINLIDSPGHVDFSSEVTAALRVTDGALVVVDCIEGVCVQTETVLRQAIQERIRPVLVLNKVDRAILELQLPPEEAYQSFAKTIENVNVIVATYMDADIGDLTMTPLNGKVAFGSGLHQWGFCLKTFSRIYAKKFNTTRAKMTRRLWGNSFFDKEASKWTNKPNGGKNKRGFAAFIMDPIIQLFDSIMKATGPSDKLTRMLTVLGVKMKSDDMAQTGKPLLKSIMQKWLPLSDVLLEMIVMHLPSPKEAQPYRIPLLYEGPMDDECGVAMRKCDPDGPLMMYVSKMVPTTEKGRFYAFGRVFSGTVTSGGKVRIMGPNFKAGGKTDLWIKNVQRTVIMMGRTVEQVPDIPAGNTCGLVGVDNYLIKSGTISSSEVAHGFKQMKFSVSPVVRVAVDVKNAADLPKLVEGLKRLAKSDPLVQIIPPDSTGQHIVAGTGELHLEICLKDLQDDFMSGAELTVSDPVVSYRETVTAKSSRTCLAKSGNGHNRLFAEADVMPIELQVEIESGQVIPDPKDAKAQERKLAATYGFEAQDVSSKKLWAFGPDGKGPNWLLDATRAVSYLNEIKESVNSGFQWAVGAGPLCEEQCRGVVLKLLDVTLHADSIHRGMGQIMPAARKVFNSSFLNASPALMEPMFLVETAVPLDSAGGVYSVLALRRGEIVEEVSREGTPMISIRSFVPVKESFGLVKALRESTGGKAFPQCVFDHWSVMPGNPLEPGTMVHGIVKEIRTRKGLSEDFPTIDSFLDRL